MRFFQKSSFLHIKTYIFYFCFLRKTEKTNNQKEKSNNKEEITNNFNNNNSKDAEYGSQKLNIYSNVYRDEKK